MKKITICALLIGIIYSCENPTKQTEGKKIQVSQSIDKIVNPTNKVILSSEIIWEKLNPARGNQSPQAGTIWGDRKGTVATGFLAKFVDGFSSPPHIHNVTYRAVVIKGLIHNDDENAKHMWMQPGSFWTQPKGESHITAAKGEENIAYVEIDHGPYLVKPKSEAFDNGERPVNIDASNIVWLDENKSNWIKNKNANISFLWKNKNLQGLFVKLPKGFKGNLVNNGTTFHAVIIQGNLTYTMPVDGEIKQLDAGSYFSTTDKAIHTISNDTEQAVVIYIRTDNSININ
ncbi:DUF4437 domain-containing protein [Kordia sp.]|uniref:DUF4437 domain-containing protein n=1 Tax=Kordia sp. TaxID=1965332 RepID=UPI003B5A70A5